MPAAAPHKKIVKKSTRKVVRFHSDRLIKLGNQQTWRKPKGIDNRIRRRYKGQIKMPTIGEQNDKKTRNLRRNARRVV